MKPETYKRAREIQERLGKLQYVQEQFRAYLDGQAQLETLPPVVSVVVGTGGVVTKADPQVKVKPIEVLNLLETIPEPIKMEDLETKISMCKDKTRLINQTYAKQQMEAMVECLENRKHYAEFMDYFNQFPYTDSDKIDALVSKYALVVRPADLFIPTLPKEASDIMTSYNAVARKIRNKTPNYYVIAEPKDFEKKQRQNDPILLVQSIFGFFWQILGAWDKELLLLWEL